MAHPHFVYDRSVDVDLAVSRLASAIGEPARARILFSLMDGHARTSTELAIVARVSPSTASAHLARLTSEHLIKLHTQGKHRYYSLEGPQVARALEGLSVLAGSKFVPTAPVRLRAARTCYDHLAGALGVQLHDRLQALQWLSKTYGLTPAGTKALSALGIDIEATKNLRRRFAYPCLDWSERRPHLGGALGAALLTAVLKNGWLLQDLDSRSLSFTRKGRSALETLLATSGLR